MTSKMLRNRIKSIFQPKFDSKIINMNQVVLEKKKTYTEKGGGRVIEVGQSVRGCESMHRCITFFWYSP